MRMSGLCGGDGGATCLVNGSGAIFYYFADQLGSTRTITTGNGPSQTPGQLCYDADFTPYGQEISYSARLQTTACPPSYRFTGYEHDSETGLDYAFGRYYSRRLGRFLSTDPLAGSIGDPQSHNAYAYALNNPLNTIDPTGQVPCPPIPVVPNPCSMAQMQSHLGGDLWGVNSDWWDEFDLLQLAFTPTFSYEALNPAYLYALDMENGDVGNIPMSIEVNFYGNIGALSLLNQAPNSAPSANHGTQPTKPTPQPPKPVPKPPLTPGQKRCVAAAASSGALAVNAGLNEVGAALTGEVSPFAAIFHGIALAEGIASGAVAVYAAFVCIGQ